MQLADKDEDAGKRRIPLAERLKTPVSRATWTKWHWNCLWTPKNKAPWSKISSSTTCKGRREEETGGRGEVAAHWPTAKG